MMSGGGKYYGRRFEADVRRGCYTKCVRKPSKVDRIIVMSRVNGCRARKLTTNRSVAFSRESVYLITIKAHNFRAKMLRFYLWRTSLRSIH